MPSRTACARTGLPGAVKGPMPPNNLGDAHQARLRNRPALLPEVPGPDEGGRFHRAAAGGRHREDSPPLRARESGDAAPPPPEDGWVDEPDAEWDSRPISSEQSGELTFVEIDEFLATF